MRQADQAGFGGGVMRSDDAARLCGHGREIDDAAPASFAHAGDDTLGHKKRRSQIDAEYALPVLEGDFGYGLGFGDASVVDEDFDFAEAAFGFRDQAFDIGGDGNVGLDGNGAAVEFFDC